MILCSCSLIEVYALPINIWDYVQTLEHIKPSKPSRFLLMHSECQPHHKALYYNSDSPTVAGP